MQLARPRPCRAPPLLHVSWSGSRSARDAAVPWCSLLDPASSSLSLAVRVLPGSCAYRRRPQSLARKVFPSRRLLPLAVKRDELVPSSSQRLSPACRASSRLWSRPLNSPTPCCQSDYRRYCVPRCALVGGAVCCAPASALVASANSGRRGICSVLAPCASALLPGPAWPPACSTVLSISSSYVSASCTITSSTMPSPALTRRAPSRCDSRTIYSSKWNTNELLATQFLCVVVRAGKIHGSALFH
ncbi:hypothetical protein Zm00014a_031580 [Zea mays]|uniref:Uncharacterized protein n=3 Tax=Zea mays TaxID=4577 RepID=A0A8J8XQB8_MAIZE|nr:hypothetical protein ZEAMMB73_Zm00001d031568 [Zea mays]PWZ58388.1 hypothetical protein Zm00014a_031580 [Zea mays]